MGDIVLKVPLERLAPWSPFSSTVWGIERPITVEEVLKACQEKRYQGFGSVTGRPDLYPEKYHQYHVERVAFLVDHPTGDPIWLDVGVPDLGCHVDWIVIDGNHRHAAAIVRGDANIAANIAGSVEHIKELLGIEYPDEDDYAR